MKVKIKATIVLETGDFVIDDEILVGESEIARAKRSSIQTIRDNAVVYAVNRRLWEHYPDAKSILLTQVEVAS